MSDIKCPFCQQKLDYDDLLGSCINEHCEESFDMVGTESLWQKVINIKQEIDRTRKALKIAKNAIESAKDHNAVNCVARGKFLSTDDVHITLYKALEQITALEQKD